MATKTMLVCDRCGRECPYDSIWAEVGTYPPVAPELAQPRQEDVDLCPIHCREALAEMVAAMPPATAAAWVAKMRTVPKPVRV